MKGMIDKMRRKEELIRYTLILIGYVIAGAAIAFDMRINIGVGPWDALSKVISEWVNVKVGTIGIIMNCACIFIQMIILKKDFKKIQIMQIPFSFILGMITNFIFYRLNLNIESLYLRIPLFLLGSSICALGVAIVMLADRITFGLEGMCMAVADTYHQKFSVMRQSVDIISLVITVFLTLMFHLEWTIGIGTIISTFYFGPVLGFFMKLLNPMVKRLCLVERVESYGI